MGLQNNYLILKQVKVMKYILIGIWLGGIGTNGILRFKN